MFFQQPYTQQLEDAREPVEDPLLLGGTPGPLESDPLLGEHLHLARLLQPQDAPAQLLTVGGACNISSDNLLHQVSQHQYNLHQLNHHHHFSSQQSGSPWARARA